MLLKVVNPYNQKVYVELPYDVDTRVREKIHTGRRAFEQWRRLPLEDRIGAVKEGLNYFRTHMQAIAEEISCQMGKPLAQSRGEFGGFFERAEYMMDIAPQALAPDVLPPKKGFHRRIEHEPLGIVLDIAAWNYPLLIAINVVVPALLAGNGVLIKHSTKTPLCGGHFENAFGSAVPGLVQDLILTHDQTLAIFNEGLVDHAVFTGSVTGGREIHRAVAAHFIDVGLELGGKDAAYVAEDADLAFTVSNVVDGACYNAGQSCCAVERAYVHRSCYDAFIERAEAVMSAYRLGDPLDENTTMGPLASRAALDLLDRQVADAVARGARLILGGRRMAATDGNFYLPTLLVDVPNDAEVMQAESFGPILPVLAVESDQEAVERMNDSRFGLTASVWTGSRERAEWFARLLRVGTVYQNRCDYLDPALPWTGVGDSGKGSSLSMYGYYHLTRRKSIHFRTET